ncbi:MAG: hypothetical protein LBU60_05240, partial [Clostridiales bacterium]|nr:hypothetical protein [Clostridiales bacterium]
MKDRLIIFSDYGLDDAVALIYLLDNRCYKNMDIVAVAGNTTAQNSLNNVQKLLANYDGDKSGLTIIDTTSEPQNFAE